jgi:hypothetical protein
MASHRKRQTFSGSNRSTVPSRQFPYPTYRSNLSAHARPYMMPSAGSQGQIFAEQLNPMQMNKVLGDLGNLNIGKDIRLLPMRGTEINLTGARPISSTDIPRSVWVIPTKFGIGRTTQLRLSSRLFLQPTVERGL